MDETPSVDTDADGVVGEYQIHALATTESPVRVADEDNWFSFDITVDNATLRLYWDDADISLARPVEIVDIDATYKIDISAVLDTITGERVFYRAVSGDKDIYNLNDDNISSLVGTEISFKGSDITDGELKLYIANWQIADYAPALTADDTTTGAEPEIDTASLASATMEYAYYKDLQAAYAALADGEYTNGLYIKALDNFTGSLAIGNESASTITIDLNGKTMTYGAGSGNNTSFFQLGNTSAKTVNIISSVDTPRYYTSNWAETSADTEDAYEITGAVLTTDSSAAAYMLLSGSAENQVDNNINIVGVNLINANLSASAVEVYGVASSTEQEGITLKNVEICGNIISSYPINMVSGVLDATNLVISGNGNSSSRTSTTINIQSVATVKISGTSTTDDETKTVTYSSRIENNTTSSDILCVIGGCLELDTVSITGNNGSMTSGSVIDVTGSGKATIKNSLVKENSARYCLYALATVTIDNSEFNGNRNTSGDSRVFHIGRGSKVDITGSTITGNSGPHLFGVNGSLTLTNSIVKQHTGISKHLFYLDDSNASVTLDNTEVYKNTLPSSSDLSIFENRRSNDGTAGKLIIKNGSKITDNSANFLIDSNNSQTSHLARRPV